VKPILAFLANFYNNLEGDSYFQVKRVKIKNEIFNQKLSKSLGFEIQMVYTKREYLNKLSPYKTFNPILEFLSLSSHNSHLSHPE